MHTHTYVYVYVSVYIYIYIYIYILYVCVYIYIYIYIHMCIKTRRRRNGYFAQRVPSLFLARSFRAPLMAFHPDQKRLGAGETGTEPNLYLVFS